MKAFNQYAIARKEASRNADLAAHEAVYTYKYEEKTYTVVAV
ncbi:hypothetical protein HMPREF0183_0034 [Brevibacterium mcbrellneri ATCC 49030]|uniref:Uncharacterized protein n=1 Tax=Brevibacterium mcbrellneri ATCC 49030 TaxID=585530 RepID=D4YJC4_9MICO|nr:hypothetical protein HMPREF0183_0034 [Brevibacterium mcbrellneri ATCC 49030]